MDKPLSRFEAQLVSDWMNENGHSVMWTTVWRLKPSQIAKKYAVSKDDVIKAARRTETE